MAKSNHNGGEAIVNFLKGKGLEEGLLDCHTAARVIPCSRVNIIQVQSKTKYSMTLTQLRSESKVNTIQLYESTRHRSIQQACFDLKFVNLTLSPGSLSTLSQPFLCIILLDLGAKVMISEAHVKEHIPVTRELFIQIMPFFPTCQLTWPQCKSSKQVKSDQVGIPTIDVEK